MGWDLEKEKERILDHWDVNTCVYSKKSLYMYYTKSHLAESVSSIHSYSGYIRRQGNCIYISQNKLFTAGM